MRRPNSTELQAVKLFSVLAGPEIERVADRIRVRTVRRGTSQLNGAHLVEAAYFVLGGAFKLMIAAPPRPNVALKVLVRGDAFGAGIPLALADQSPQIRVICLEAGELLELPTPDLHKLLEDFPTLRAAWTDMLAAIVTEQTNRIYELCALSARERLLAERLRIASADGRAEGKFIIRPAPTHQSLAEAIGAAREVVTRALRSMAQEGLISAEPGSIELHDVRQLADLDFATTGRRIFDASPERSGPPSAHM